LLVAIWAIAPVSHADPNATSRIVLDLCSMNRHESFTKVDES
jgi:hypothetical protein